MKSKESVVVRSTVPASFLPRLRQEARRFYALWGVSPGEDGQLLLAAASAWLSVSDYLTGVDAEVAAALNDAIRDGLTGLFPD